MTKQENKYSLTVFVFFIIGKNTYALFCIYGCGNNSLFGHSWSDVFFGASVSAGALFYVKGVGRVGDEKEFYKKLYHKMFNEVTDTIENLVKLQQDAEEMYLQYYDEKGEKKGSRLGR